MLDNPGRIAVSDEQLVAAVLQGDISAFGAIVERYWKMATGLALSRIHNTAEAEDIAQESFLKAYSNLHRLRDPSRFAGWLCMIVSQQCVNYIRKTAHNNKVLSRQAPAAADLCTVAANPGLSEKQVHFVRETVGRLPGKFRKLIVMRFVAGLSSVEIAKQLGKRPGTVRVWLHRAYNILRKDLAPVLEEIKS